MTDTEIIDAEIVRSDAEYYAELFRDDPARAFGVMAAQMARMDALLDQLEPLVNDPSRLLAGVPAPLRAMLGL